ncbi:MAG: DNA-3-methyladenine glycosylase I, partial [Planctomycetota bacterium]
VEARRCAWANSDPLYIAYHDDEWGVPVHNDRTLFEMLVLEGFQAGLSWLTILKKRDAFRKAFGRFDPRKVARYTRRDVNRLSKKKDIVRNRLKIEAAITNAGAFLVVQKEFGSFDSYIRHFTGGKTLRLKKRARTWQDLPTESPESRAMSADLKRRGFRFVGPIICYAFMQAVGMADDHLAGCFRAAKISRKKPMPPTRYVTRQTARSRSSSGQ